MHIPGIGLGQWSMYMGQIFLYFHYISNDVYFIHMNGNEV